MIRDLSETLRAMLDDPALAATYPELGAAQIVFDRPTDQFNPSQTTIDMYLFDIRENLELRSNEPIIERNNGIATIHKPPMRVACSYLVTAWPVGGADVALQEHRLLSQVLALLSIYPTIPTKYLKGTLVGQQPPLPMVSPQIDGLKNPSEFWTAMGNKLRASLTLMATISLPTFGPDTAATVASSEIRFGARVSADVESIIPATLQDTYTIGGTVTDGTNAPVANATVSIPSIGIQTATDADGDFNLGAVVAGVYTLHVVSGAKTRDVSITVPASAGSNFNVKLT